MVSKRNRIDINNASKKLLEQFAKDYSSIDRKAIVELALYSFKHRCDLEAGALQVKKVLPDILSDKNVG